VPEHLSEPTVEIVSIREGKEEGENEKLREI
jgi:hypothetical protein